MGIDPTSADMNAARQADDIANAAGRQAVLRDETRLDHDETNVQLGNGLPVLAADGTEVGVVELQSGGYFKLDRRGGEAAWLSETYIESNDGRTVKLVLEADELDDHTLRQPGLQTLDRHLTGTGTRVQTELDALHVREMMEKELIAQRGTMDTDVHQDPGA